MYFVNLYWKVGSKPSTLSGTTLNERINNENRNMANRSNIQYFFLILSSIDISQFILFLHFIIINTDIFGSNIDRIFDIVPLNGWNPDP